MADLTQDQIHEIIKCRDDIVYFANTYMCLQTPLSSEQSEILLKLHNDEFVAEVLPRRFGKTFLMSINILHYVMFDEHKTVAIKSARYSMTTDWMHTIVTLFRKIPDYMKSALNINTVKLNKSLIDFENGCRIIVVSGIDSLRGSTINYVVADEAGIIPDSLIYLVESCFPVMRPDKNSKFATLTTDPIPSNIAVKLLLGDKNNIGWAHIAGWSHEQIAEWILING